MTLQSHSWAYIQRRTWPEKIYAPQCSPQCLLIAALFTTAKTWKQTKCPPTEEWIKKMCYINAKDYYSVITKNEIMPSAAAWMDPETVILTEVSQTGKEKYHTTSLTCGI